MCVSDSLVVLSQLLLDCGSDVWMYTHCTWRLSTAWKSTLSSERPNTLARSDDYKRNHKGRASVCRVCSCMCWVRHVPEKGERGRERGERGEIGGRGQSRESGERYF